MVKRYQIINKSRRQNRWSLADQWNPRQCHLGPPSCIDSDAAEAVWTAEVCVDRTAGEARVTRRIKTEVHGVDSRTRRAIGGGDPKVPTNRSFDLIGGHAER
ncbi:hypothetical protein Aiant_02540 [Actinoplanes ianthinogenes]|uniref:Uncharacterized protein n=1 Tax=Actinoplanes ianthinogenes TaxID=122358 RepID=A0ABM7LK12_9ACTN|nr:hypothetical protein Aiant_02540 [Actinoplanes ianthinogenes]